MKKIIPFLLLAAALLAFVSCKPEPESFTVKFDLNGGTVSTTIEDQTVKNGDKAAKPVETPENTSSKGFRFWTINGETEYDFSSPVKKDLTIRAVYWTAAEVGQLDKEAYCLTFLTQSLFLNKKLYDGTEASKIFDKNNPGDQETLGSLLMLSLVSVKYDSEHNEFVPCITHDGKEYETDDSKIKFVLDDVSVEKNNSTKVPGETEMTGTYNVKLENVKIKATFTYTEGTTTWNETLETDFTIDAVMTGTVVESLTVMKIDSFLTVNGSEYPEFKASIIYEGSDDFTYDYKGYKGKIKTK